MSRAFTYRFEDGYEVEFELMDSHTLEHLERFHGDCIYNGWAEFMGVGEPSRLGVIGGSNTRGDGFRTGYNPALGMEIKSPSHYRQVLKEKGLREVGNEKIGGGKKQSKFLDSKDLSEMVEKKELSSEAAEAVSKAI